MKIIIILLTISCISCKRQSDKGDNINGQLSTNFYSTKDMDIDTLQILVLKGRQYKNAQYKVLKIYNLTNDLTRIELTKNKIAVADFPLPSLDDIKNFQVNKIIEVRNGFELAVNWGGGDFFYRRKFYFVFRDGRFYFDKLKMSIYIQPLNKETKSVKRLYPSLHT